MVARHCLAWSVSSSFKYYPPNLDEKFAPPDPSVKLSEYVEEEKAAGRSRGRL
jgi:hypothetical protein